MRTHAQQALFPGPCPDDAREELWKLSRGVATSEAQAGRLMRIACWLWYRQRVRDRAIIRRALERSTRAREPFAYLQPDGKAVGAIVGSVAVERAELERSRILDEERTVLTRPNQVSALVAQLAGAMALSPGRNEWDVKQETTRSI